MDGPRFDALARSLGAGRDRRRFVQLISGLTAGSLLSAVPGLMDADAHDKREKCKKINDKDKRKKCLAKAKKHEKKHEENAVVSHCDEYSPIECGPNCCYPDEPLCCAAPFAEGGTDCYESDHYCCPAESGGGACPTGESCCSPRDGYSSCIHPVENRFCCPPDVGGSCSELAHCCPPALNNDFNYGCCYGDEACCNADTDCNQAAGEECYYGCCYAFS